MTSIYTPQENLKGMNPKSLKTKGNNNCPEESLKKLAYLLGRNAAIIDSSKESE